jgi:hypothetical protein
MRLSLTPDEALAVVARRFLTKPGMIRSAAAG